MISLLLSYCCTVPSFEKSITAGWTSNLLDTRYSDSANTSAMGIYLTADGRFRLSLLKCNLHSSLEYSSI